MVTVVDAASLTRDYASLDFLRERVETADDSHERTLVDLLVEQIEFADVIVINKVSAASGREWGEARTIIARRPRD